MLGLSGNSGAAETAAVNPMLMLDHDQMQKLESVLQSEEAKSFLGEVLASPTTGSNIAGEAALGQHLGQLLGVEENKEEPVPPTGTDSFVGATSESGSSADEGSRRGGRRGGRRSQRQADREMREEAEKIRAANVEEMKSEQKKTEEKDEDSVEQEDEKEDEIAKEEDESSEKEDGADDEEEEKP